jgi:hypothetical protein
MRTKARLRRLAAKAKQYCDQCFACPAIAPFDMAEGEEESRPAPPVYARCSRVEMASDTAQPSESEHGARPRKAA